MPAIDFPAAPAVNDEYSFEGRTWRWNGTGWEVKEYPAALLAGTAANPSLYFSGDPNTGLFSPGADQVALSTGGTGRLFVDGSGNVGVGTGPTNVAGFKRIDIGEAGVSNGLLTLRSSGGAQEANISCSATGLAFTTNSYATPFDAKASEIIFGTGSSGTERLRITSTGSVGVGTTSPAKLLHVQSGSVTGAARGGSFTKTLFESSDAVTSYWEFQAASTAVNGLLFSKGNTGSYGLVQYNHNTDSLNVYTNSNERVRIDSSGRLGIGTTSPDTLTHISASAGATLRIESTTTALVENSIVGNIEFEANDASAQGTGIKASIGAYSDVAAGNVVSLRLHAGASTEATGTERYRISGDGQHIFGGVGGISTAERARIDSSGRLLVGTSSARANFFGLGASGALQVEGTTLNTSVFSLTSNQANVNASWLVIAKSRGTTVGSNTAVIANDTVGSISFQAADGTNLIEAAHIRAFVDGTPGANDMPGRLVFSTTADGASSPTERLRIDSAGVLQVADAGNIAVGTTTGTKIGTATTQKLGFFNKTPVVQPAAVADATDAASVITQLNALLARMRDLGLIAT